ncbi:MAG: DNA polymerase Y family protein [Xanthomonadales bacterium]|nr:DNA polymerase Y family protein [Xanthomonadales bacterium]
MRWACLLLPHLAMDTVLRADPEPERPLVLVAGPAQRRELHAVSPAAAALGLRRGMLVSAAQALTSAFVPHEYDPKAEAQARDLLATWAYSFSSQVSLDFAHALVLEIGASRALFGDWPMLSRRLRSELGDLGFRHRLVAAPNPYATRVLANAYDEIGIDDPQLDQALGQLPIERSGLPLEIATAFSRMGMRKLRQVFELPRETVTRRFPKTVLAHLDQIRGHVEPPLRYFEPPDRFEAFIEFEYEVETSQGLLFPLRRLTSDLSAFLSSRDGGVQRFSLHFAHEFHPATIIAIGLLSAERDAGVLFDIARSRLEQIRLPAATRALRLVADELPAFVPASRDLFDTRPQQAVPWEQLRERLRARLGDDAVHGIGVEADHRPERATGTMMPRLPPPALPVRPGWLLDRPIPMRETRFEILSGPERIESGWWDDGDARRDYYVIRTSQGQRAWVFCAPGERGPFLLHGWFA